MARKNILLTGRPGVGKTTVVSSLAQMFAPLAGGFVTGEIRESGVRLGFSVTSLLGKSAIMASVDSRSAVRVGKYGVDVPAFERIALPALGDALERKRLAVIDEIGKMELASPRFCDLVLEVLDSPLVVVATVMEKPHPFADRLKARSDVELVEVTRENRADLPELIAGVVKRRMEEE